MCSWPVGVVLSSSSRSEVEQCPSGTRLTAPPCVSRPGAYLVCTSSISCVWTSGSSPIRSAPSAGWTLKRSCLPRVDAVCRLPSPRRRRHHHRHPWFRPARPSSLLLPTERFNLRSFWVSLQCCSQPKMAWVTCAVLLRENDRTQKNKTSDRRSIEPRVPHINTTATESPLRVQGFIVFMKLLCSFWLFPQVSYLFCFLCMSPCNAFLCTCYTGATRPNNFCRWGSLR